MNWHIGIRVIMQRAALFDLAAWAASPRAREWEPPLSRAEKEW